MKNTFLLTFTLLFAAAQGGAFAWDGSGTASDPYQIRNSADWTTLAQKVANGEVADGTAFRLMGDISITTPVGTTDHHFKGTFDGGGHTITATLSAANGRTAPFAFIESSTISHLYVDGTIQGGLHTAGLAGSVSGTNNVISDCRVSAKITTFPENGMIIVGGFVGNGSNVTVDGCMFDGELITNTAQDFSYGGAFMGWSTSSPVSAIVKNCIENGSYSGITHVGLNYTDDHVASTIRATNCYTLSHNWGEVKRGYKLIYLSDTFQPTYAPTDIYTTSGIEASAVGLKLGDIFYAGSGETVTVYTPREEGVLADGFVGYDFSTQTEGLDNPTISFGNYVLTMPARDVYMSQYKNFTGVGNADEPYLIENEDDWQHFALNLSDYNLRDKHYLLTNDIDIHVPAGYEFTHSGDLIKGHFLGTFDGGGHTITAHLSGGTYASTFYKINGATIKNLHIAGEISGGIHSSGLVGGIPTEDGKSNLIENCRVSADITCSSTHAGGFVGHASSSTVTLRGCIFDGKISGNSLTYIGYLIGWCENSTGITLHNCAAYNYSASGANGCKMDLVWDSTGTARCSSATNTYGGTAVGKRLVALHSTKMPLRLTYIPSNGMAEPIEYTTARLASYGMGLLYNGDMFLVGQDERPGFHIQVDEGLSYTDCSTTVEGATLSFTSGGWFEVTFPDNLTTADVGINATIVSDNGLQGEGTEETPYLIRNVIDWMTLSIRVEAGHQYKDKVFRMTQDIDCEGTAVGTAATPFAGIFDGDGHTLTFNAGKEYAPTASLIAPFYRVSEATFRHLHTAGNICTSAQYSGGIISQVVGTKVTRLYDCHSTVTLLSTINGDASNGGLVGAASNCDSLVIDHCTFTGNLQKKNVATNCGGFVGWSNVPVTIRHGLFDPDDTRFSNVVNIGQNFARMSNYTNLKLEECYTTYNFTPDNVLSIRQGKFVIDGVSVPNGASYEFVDDPEVIINGRNFYKNGCWIRTTLDDRVPFDHWEDGISNCFISDPWSRSGLHQLKDLTRNPSLTIKTSSIPEPETERTLWGVKYRYLSRRDYHFYVSDDDRMAKGWTFENNDNDANMIVKDSDDNASEITAITGFKESDYNSDGVQIHNDLVGDWRNHTHLGLIAPHAFRGSTALETIYFKDTDANNYNTLLPFDFTIDQGAFENCPNFRELKMMQYTTRGDNHWEALSSTQVTNVADDAFNGCPKLRISAQADKYQGFLSSATWKKHYSRFIVYEATTKDFTVEGVQYHWYRTNDQENALKNDDEGKQQMMSQIGAWNGDFQQFNAASLLDTKDNCNVYYTSIIGVNNSTIDSKGGIMKIFNDPGSYYNYKTIVLNRDAIKGNTHVQYIEFWETDGRSENSYSNLKMVIPNGAFQGCTNLKELRLFYYVQDGDDRWIALGPKDVIPGDNIFGRPTLEELASCDSTYYMNEMAKNPTNFKILVSTELYPEFKDDPNWQPYLGYIEPVDYSPAPRSDFSEDGLTYGYMTSPGGIMQASQVVSQDVSWWTAPRIAIEVAMAAYTIGTWATAQGTTTALTASASGAESVFRNCGEEVAAQQLVVQAIDAQASALASATGKEAILNAILEFSVTEAGQKSMQGVVASSVISELVKTGIVSSSGFINSFMMNPMMLGRLATTLSSHQAVMLQMAVFQLARHELFLASTELTALQASLKAAEQAWKTILVKKAFAESLDWTVKTTSKSLFHVANPISMMTSTAGLISSKCWGGSGSYNADAMNKGMRENILSNIHQVGLVGGGYVITTPQKNLVYHTYVKSAADNVQNALIYAGFDNDNNSNTSNRTMTFLPKTFRDKTSLKTVKFHDISNQSSNTGMPFLFTIPDSAFVGCTALTEFSTLLQTDGNGTRALGPENFILAGDSIFAGRKCKAEVDSLTNIGQGAELVPFYIIVDPLRKEDFLASESWKPLERFFKYESAQPAAKYNEYGAQYAYAYEQNSIKKEHKVTGHLIEHTLVVGPDDSFITGHQGAVKLCNDIGTYNNYQMDEVMPEAFKDNKNLRTVSFVDLYGFSVFGDCYTDLQVHLGDRAFQGCSNLANLDLLYMVTDGKNHIEPMTPQMISIGKDVFKDSPAWLKMMPQQVAWFEADSTWAKYKNRFLPCVVRFTDPGIKAALKDMSYYDPANTGTDPALWDDYCDFARIAGAGFSWLNGKFTAQKEKIHSFADFRYFEKVGLNYVGADWFRDCSNLGHIVLPSTITTIGSRAFNNCSSLTEIEIPKGVTSIGDYAFGLCDKLTTIVVRGTEPAVLGTNVFSKNSGLRIYVPKGNVADYKAQWPAYEDYIVGDNEYILNKVVTVTAPGQLATKLGLTLRKENSKVHYIEGAYTKYDSLTVIGPLNGEDVAVLRHMMGADAYNSDFTDGQLRYLNLWDAQLKADNANSYNGYGVDEYLEKDNWVGEYMFHNCNALESVVLPKTVTEIGENTFQEAYGLKRIAVGRNTTKYTRDLLQDLTGIEELVFLTDHFATSESSDPWEAPIRQVYTLPSQIGDYLGDPGLTQQAQDITSPFLTDDVMWALAEKGHFFPSSYLQLESVENIFSGNTTIKDLDDFHLFHNVKRLENTFSGMTNLETITLPSGIEHIGASAFSGCTKLKTIHTGSVEVVEDSENTENPVQYIVPELAQNAFASLPADFKILVPKEYCKLYRERWSQYADHINPDKTFFADAEVVTVTVTQPNTLAAALGLTTTTKSATGWGGSYVNSLKGDYSRLHKLKVVGPISGGDLDVLRYLSGYCPWTCTRNYTGKLEYIDLYDAQLKATDVGVSGYRRNATSFMISEDFNLWKVYDDNVLPHHAFLRAYNLRTLILPRTCNKVDERAMQECEGLETLVLGDDMTEFNWSALDDNAMLTRMYILASQKVRISNEWAVWRWLCNNYNPTFDAFYVRPSLYDEYLRDDAYTGSSWQRTNNVSSGAFEDDESFAAFGAHAAATMDDLMQVYSVKGWFDTHSDVKDLTALGYAAIDTLYAEDMQKLTQLEKLTLPVTLASIGKEAFAQSPNLRYVDALMSNDELVDSIKTRGLEALGIDSLQTLVYMPGSYGEAKGTNIVVNNGASFSAETFRLQDGKDYCVPYPFQTDDIQYTRNLSNTSLIYTVCLPYRLALPDGAKAYQLSERDGNQLVFQEVTGELTPMQPYIVKTSSTGTILSSDIQQTIPASGGATFGQQDNVAGYSMRGTFQLIDNATLHDLSGYLMQSDNRWYPAPANVPAAYVPAYRCYLLQNSGGNAKSLTMKLVDEDPNAIETIRTIDLDGDENIYDLSGRRQMVNGKWSNGKLPKSIYIKNGQKYINK